jgi:hypothetical protein
MLIIPLTRILLHMPDSCKANGEKEKASLNEKTNWESPQLRNPFHCRDQLYQPTDGKEIQVPNLPQITKITQSWKKLKKSLMNAME